MKLNNLPYSFLLLFLAISTVSLAQEIDHDYFKSPIKPGGRNYLSGNFAELRPNHFHTGLDFKTGGQEGEPILAAADGWVHRIKVSSFGYGNVIYLKHPNGKITLYGHLRNFNQELSAFMRKKMYEAKVNELEVYPEPGELQVKQGERIADSGNTGGSGGPHLHFEIRDSLDRAVDALPFGFEEVLDRTPPTPQSIAIVPLDIDSRVNGKFERLEITPVSSGRNYRLPSTVKITGRVGLEIRSYDQLDGASNRNGYPYFELADSTGTLFKLLVDKVDFNLSRQFLLHTHQNRYTKLYKQENLKFEFLHPNTPTTGHLELAQGVRKDYILTLKDARGNKREIGISLEGEEQSFTANDGVAPSRASIDYLDNILKIQAPISPKGGLAKFFVGTNTFEMLPVYQDANSRTYLWDMDFGIPEKVDICSELLTLGVQAKIPAGKQYAYADENVQIHFGQETVLDDLFLRVSQSGSSSAPTLQINDRSEYLWRSMEISWNLPGYTGPKDRAHAYLVNGNSKSFLGGTWSGNHLNFNSRYFGDFKILEDHAAPSISVVRVNSSDLRFVIRDNLSGIDSFEAYVDGEWVLMRYEHKQAVIWSEKLENKPFKGEVLLKVHDNAGNTAEWKGTIG
ncbi:M23 family metallopeptidase [Algoriphagus halophytocola]|uniref:M23 family metallopeptidase n=1 Tax=Algoriphagus halophytocola TaxID=2991499 RepID=UPI0022DD38D9|nr:M23 family metallopeptidase [Algoriphagus sp. TR-M9]WBL44600.1 M23 family metallopeptidase [Algoriphagus sp. TR-M9]